MEKKEKKKEKKKKSWGFAVFMLLCLLGVGGGLWYFNYYVPGQYVIEEPVEVETREIWTGPRDIFGSPEETLRTQFETYVNALYESPASFFVAEIAATSVDEMTSGYDNYTSISETNKETFDSTINMESDGIMGLYGTRAKYFLNNDYERVLKAQDGEVEASSPEDLFGNTNSVPTCVNEVFGTNIKDYFNTHQLVLNCENLKVEKVCAANTPPVNVYGDGVNEYFANIYAIVTGTAEVKTESAVGDMSDMGIFGQVGETVTVRFVISGHNLATQNIYLNRVE